MDFSPHPIHLQLTGCITASAFYHGFAKERVGRRFLVSNVSRSQSNTMSRTFHCPRATGLLGHTQAHSSSRTIDRIRE